MSQQPVYRRPRSHAYSCRCPRCDQPAEWGILLPLIFGAGLIAVVGFWPAMVWHGYTDTGGWRWDIHSTVGCLVWWGILVFLGFLCWLAGDRTAKEVTAPPSVAELLPPPPSVTVPRCRHLNAVPVDNLYDPDQPPWAWLCPAETGGCGRRLPAEFGRLRRSCCGTAHGTPHWWNCPEGAAA